LRIGHATGIIKFFSWFSFKPPHDLPFPIPPVSASLPAEREIIPTMQLQTFLNRFHISEERFAKSGLKWRDLLSIRKSYEQIRPEMEPVAAYVADRLRTVPCIHSVRTRIKDPDHLLAKIIRRKLEMPENNITLDNYKQVITDLIGVRALHLFKDDWEQIHEFIIDSWTMMRKPVAYTSDGDCRGFIARLKDASCRIRKHPFGYRSVHYLICFERSRRENIPVEIQVRTCLEEAWSEIDHIARYPYSDSDSMVRQYLAVFNRLVSQADRIGSFIRFLRDEMEEGVSIPECGREIGDVIIDELQTEFGELHDMSKKHLKPRESETEEAEENESTSGSSRPSIPV
jgi:ppGpp synthetase/RelA/SpoT-type nucleotidyltranferase